MEIFNKYKDTLGDFINSSNVEFLEKLKSKSILINTRLHLEKDYLDKDRRGQKGKKSY